MLFLFSITLFVSATLLFWIQPMFGKMVLPTLGSSPSVWNTCMVFFQASLLLGYVYAHVSTTFLGVKKQALLHLGLIFLPLLVLPVSILNSCNPPTDENPIPWLLLLMSASVGLPFFMISCNAPMLQKWFSATSHKEAGDPYFLYVASNAGSMLGLLSYPLFVEPNFTLVYQNKLWMYGYYLLLSLIIVCAIYLWRNYTNVETPQREVSTIKINDRLWWIVLSFVPSSLLLGVTSYLSTDISAIPFLWVIPLAIYLLSFIFVFSREKIISHKLMVDIFPFLILPVMIYIISAQTKIVWLTFLFHLLTFFVACMICHGELANKRPEPAHLTEYYLWISVGGFLGGVFNAIIAPLVFNTVVEYPLALVLACLLRPALSQIKLSKKAVLLDFLLPVLLGIFLIAVTFVLKKFEIGIYWLPGVLTLAVPAVVCYSFSKRPIRFGLGVGVVILVSNLCTTSKILYRERSFFGVLKVIIDSDGKYKNLIHGKTIHGREIITGKRPHEPLTYYHKEGPIGQFFNYFNESHKGGKVAAVGLGSGSVAYYGTAEQKWTFFEIDPLVKKIATNEKYFTFLKDAKAKWKIVLGDGRLSLKQSQDKYFDLIIFDAFSSDAIPVHLITLDAVKLYLTKIKENGILAFHISNKYMKLDPVLGDIASSLGLYAVIQRDLNMSSLDQENGKEPSVWVLMTRRQDNLGKLTFDNRWVQLTEKTGRNVWTDDYSNVLGVFNWGRI